MTEQIIKLKKKQWYQILAPKEFNDIVLGETLAYEPKELLGKTLSCSLMNLFRDIKKQNVNIYFKVTEVEGDKAKAIMISYELVPSSIKRFVRRDSEKIDLSFTCETSDNIFLRIKAIIVTKSEVKGSITSKLRINYVNMIAKTIKKMTFQELNKELIDHKIQNAIKENLNKIYPLRVCEIRYVGIEAREKPQEVKKLS
ncbi:hypothetical protein HYW99_01145 [Candidatus Woesearchaeota archaeon]|nr:hypothetical protein [Candidatus Woesearchaeota archaeon]